MEKIRVIYKDKEYLLLNQYASGFCEIAEETDQIVKIVHFSELSLIK